MAEVSSRIMTLPTLALRGVSVFPGTVLHFDVERPMSIAALNAAIGTDRMIFLVAQRDMSVDAPRFGDLCEVGTVCRRSLARCSPSTMHLTFPPGVRRIWLRRQTVQNSHR